MTHSATGHRTAPLGVPPAGSGKHHFHPISLSPRLSLRSLSPRVHPDDRRGIWVDLDQRRSWSAVSLMSPVRSEGHCRSSRSWAILNGLTCDLLENPLSWLISATGLASACADWCASRLSERAVDSNGIHIDRVVCCYCSHFERLAYCVWRCSPTYGQALVHML